MGGSGHGGVESSKSFAVGKRGVGGVIRERNQVPLDRKGGSSGRRGRKRRRRREISQRKGEEVGGGGEGEVGRRDGDEEAAGLGVGGSKQDKC